MDDEIEQKEPSEQQEKPRSKAVLFLLFIPLIVIVVVVLSTMKGTQDKQPALKHPNTPEFKAYEEMMAKLKERLLNAKRMSKDTNLPRIEKVVGDGVAVIDKLYQESTNIPLKVVHDQALKLQSIAEQIYNEEYVQVKDGGGDPKRAVLDESTLYLMCAMDIYEAMRKIYAYLREIGQIPQLKEGERDKWENDCQSANELMSQIRRE
jgi:hypothetical protein